MLFCPFSIKGNTVLLAEILDGYFHNTYDQNGYSKLI